jgi:ATP-dependent RNA helicase MSS116, mitochondrial
MNRIIGSFSRYISSPRINFGLLSRDMRCINSRYPHVTVPSVCRFASTQNLHDFDLSKDNDAYDSSTEVFFKDLVGLDSSLLQSIDKLGLSKMTPIQAKTFEPIISGKDVLARAQTGTGKTFAFLVPTVQLLLKMEPVSKIQVLILSPTRELATQIDSQIEALLSARKKDHRITHQIIYGGVSKQKDIDKIMNQLPNILVATPGRLVDHLKNTVIRGKNFKDLISKVDVLILDEADRYMEMGEDIPIILSSMQRKRQNLLFSATVPDAVLDFLNNFMKKDYENIDCISSDGSNETSKIVQQSHIILKKNFTTGVVETIRHFMENKSSPSKIIVFFPTNNMVTFFAKLFNFGLGSSGHYVLEMHSKKTQSYRNTVSQRFREMKRGAMFTSDVSARGVDYPGVTHVIQVGLPSSQESYVHRLGRTGRAGTTGEGLLILTKTEVAFLNMLKDRGIQIPVNTELQNMVDSDDPSTKVRQELVPVMESITSGRNEALVKAAEDTYRSILGYYNGKLKTVGSPGASKLVEFCNSLSKQIGLSKPPKLSAKLAQKMGLLKVPGIELGDGDDDDDEGTNNQRHKTNDDRKKSSGQNEKRGRYR